MDKKRGLKNVLVAIAFKVLIAFFAIIERRYIINVLGNEVNGLYSLYGSIIGFLSVAELGVGSAITYCMYKPIVEGDTNTVSALYNLFKRVYYIIGLIILLAGIFIIPFLPRLAKDYSEINQNIPFTYLIMLLSVVLTYGYSSRTSLLNAYKNNYITTTIHSVGAILQYGIQIAAIFLTRSFDIYLLCRIIAVVVQWIATKLITDKKCGIVISYKGAILKDEAKADVVRNVRAMFMHKIGAILVNTIDSLIISAFIGVVILGKYSNYTTIMTSLMSILSLIFTSLTSVVGHACVKEDKKRILRYYNFFFAFNTSIAVIFFLGYYAVIDDLIIILYGKDLVMERSISFVITLNYFIQFLRRSTILFREASGTFYYDRFKPLFEGVSNLLFSILFVNWFGVTGVIIATIMTNLIICHTIEPRVFFKYYMQESAKNHYIENYLYIAVFGIVLLLFDYIRVNADSHIISLLLNGSISVGVSLVLCLMIYFWNNDYRKTIRSSLNAKRIKALLARRR